MSFRSILVPLDGSDFAETALPMARVLARRLDAELHLVHVLQRIPDYALKTPHEDLRWDQEAVPAAEEYLDGIAERLEEEHGVRSRTAVLQGSVVDAIVDYLEEEGVGLAVLTTHGQGGFGRWWLGSVADGLVRRARPPLLLLRPWDDTGELEPGRERFEHVVVPLDGSDLAEEILPHAVEVGRPFEARYTLIQAVPASVQLGRFFGAPGFAVGPAGEAERKKDARQYLEGVAERLRHRGMTVDVEVVPASRPEEGVLSHVASSDADLVALATHGRGGVSRMVLGSVADKVVRGAARPLLVIRPGDPEEEAE